MDVWYEIDGKRYKAQVVETNPSTSDADEVGTLSDHIRRLLTQTTLAEAGYYLREFLGRSQVWKIIAIGAGIGAVGGGLLAWFLWKRYHERA